MKKSYETPSVEKIAFRYRDQVVAASGEQSLTEEFKPQIGRLNNESWGACKLYLAEAINISICNIA